MLVWKTRRNVYGGKTLDEMGTHLKGETNEWHDVYWVDYGGAKVSCVLTVTKKDV